MSRKKAVLLVIGCVLLCLIALRESGVIDASMYKSALSVTQTTTINQSHSGNKDHLSYHLVLRYGNETLYDLTHSTDNLPPVEIEAALKEPGYSGNCALPLVKNFKMTYQCEFKTVKSLDGTTVTGKIAGEVSARIYGFCSRRKARKLAFEEAKEQVNHYFQQLNLQ